MAAIDTVALLRAINAPPSLGKYSAAYSDPSFAGLFPGIGSTGGAAIMRMKDAAGVQAAANEWKKVLEEGSNSFNGMVFGDTPGGAQSNLLNLRSQNISRALRMAELQAQENARQSALAESAAYHRDANERAAQNDWLDFLSSIARNQQDAGYKDAVATARGGLAQQMSALTGQRGALDAQDAAALQQENDLMALLGERAEAASTAYGSASGPAPYTYDADGIPKFSNPAAEQAMWGGGANDLNVRQMYNALLAESAKRKGQRTSTSNAIELLLRQYSNPAVQVPGINVNAMLSAARNRPTVGQVAKSWVFDPRTLTVR